MCMYVYFSYEYSIVEYAAVTDTDPPVDWTVSMTDVIGEAHGLL